MIPFSRTRVEESRKPDMKMLPDGRYRLTRYLTAAQGWNITKDLFLPWGTLDDGATIPEFKTEAFAGLRLIDQSIEKSRPLSQNEASISAASVLVRVYEQLPETGEVLVGKLTRRTDENGRDGYEGVFISLSSALEVVTTVGVTVAPGVDAVLSTQTVENNGTVRTANRRYIATVDTLTQIGDETLGVKFETGIQTMGALAANLPADRIITRQYSITAAQAHNQIVRLMPPAINDPIFTAAVIIDQDIKPVGKTGSVVTRVFADVPTAYSDWDDMVITFPGVEEGISDFSDFAFRSEPISESVAVRIDRKFFLSNPQRIPKIKEFRPVEEKGNRTGVLTETTTPSSDEYVAYVQSGTWLVDKCSIHRWRGDIWERRTIYFKAQ